MVVRYSDMLDMLAARHFLDRGQVSRLLRATFAAISAGTAQGERVNIPNFGVFQPRRHEGRRARNPKTGELVEIAATNKLRFIASRTLREALNGPTKLTPAQAITLALRQPLLLPKRRPGRPRRTPPVPPTTRDQTVTAE